MPRRCALAASPSTRMAATPDKLSLATLLVAAGASRRLGQPKQLVRHRGRPLLAHTLDVALAAGGAPVTVVLGAHADLIRAQLPPLPAGVTFVENPAWAEGMGTSIAHGLQTLLAAHPATTGVLILVCDQPALDTALVKDFITRATVEPAAIVVADYGTGRGPPVYFPQSCFPDLLALRGDLGAKAVLRHHAQLVRTVPFPEGALDLDTPGDLARHQS